MPAGDYPHIEESLAGPVADIIRREWITLAMPYSATGQYIRGIRDATTEYPYGGNSLSVSIANHSPYAGIVEEGHQGFHLPSRIANWPHRNKRGRGYMVIPFRHFTPGTVSSSGRAMRGAMPADIYERAKQLGADRLRGLGDLYKQSKSYRQMIGANRAMGARVSEGLIHAAALARRQPGRPGGYTWKSSPYEGMIRNAQVTPNVDQGVYTTFRVMTEDSPGWYIPAQPGRHLAQQAAESATPVIRQIIAQAAMLDAVQVVANVFSSAGYQVRVR